MGYLFTALTVVCNGIKGIAGKSLSRIINTVRGNILCQLIRLVFSLLLSFVLSLVVCGINAFEIDWVIILITLISGLCMAVFNILWIAMVQQSVFVLADAFSMLSVVVPTLVGLFVYGEKVTYLHYIAFGLMIIACVLLTKHSSNSVKKFTLFGALLCLFYFIANAGLDTGKLVFTNYIKANNLSVNSTIYTFYLFVFGTAFLFLFSLPILFKKKIENGVEVAKDKITWKHTVYAATMGILMIGVQIFGVEANMYLDGNIVYPILKAGGILVNTFIGVVLYKEKRGWMLYVSIAALLGSVALISIAGFMT